MSDEQGEPTKTSEEPGPDSRLTVRLLSRATASLGLIDVRGAEQHYARIMDWLAARSPLLEHLRTRYGPTEGQALTGLALAEPWSAEGSHTGEERINLSATPVNFTAPTAEQIHTHVAHLPDDSDAAEQSEARRITRRGLPTFAPASPETGPDADPSRERTEVVRQEQGELFKPAIELTVSNQERARDLQSPPLFKEIPAATVESPRARPADTALTSRPQPASHLTPESTSSHAPRTLPSVEERVTDSTAVQAKPLARGGAPFTGAAESAPMPPAGPNVAPVSTSVNDAAVVNNPAGAVKPGVPRVTESRVIESTGTDAVPFMPTSRATFSTRERGDATGAQVVNEAKGTTLNRSGASEDAKGPAELAAGVKLLIAGETRTASVSFETPRPLAQAREIHSYAPEIRAGDSVRASEDLRAQSPLPLASSPATVERAEPVPRMNDEAPAVTRASSQGVVETYTPVRAVASARADEVNVQRLTEQVSRHLMRRLLVERERRGLGRR